MQLMCLKGASTSVQLSRQVLDENACQRASTKSFAAHPHSCERVPDIALAITLWSFAERGRKDCTDGCEMLVEHCQAVSFKIKSSPESLEPCWNTEQMPHSLEPVSSNQSAHEQKEINSMQELTFKSAIKHGKLKGIWKPQQQGTRTHPTCRQPLQQMPMLRLCQLPHPGC